MTGYWWQQRHIGVACYWWHQRVLRTHRWPWLKVESWKLQYRWLLGMDKLLEVRWDRLTEQWLWWQELGINEQLFEDFLAVIYAPA
jgi:hypothetical protein